MSDAKLPRETKVREIKLYAINYICGGAGTSADPLRTRTQYITENGEEMIKRSDIPETPTAS